MSELRQRILDAAYKQFEATGYDSVTMRSIAKELKVTHPALYTYFKDKEDIFATLKYDVFRKLKENLFIGINPHVTFHEIVMKLTHNFIDFIDQEHPYFKLLFLLDGNGKSSEVQLQILEYIDELLVLPEANYNLSQLFWYSLIGHSYARYAQEISRKRLLELMEELVQRLSKSQ